MSLNLKPYTLNPKIVITARPGTVESSQVVYPQLEIPMHKHKEWIQRLGHDLQFVYIGESNGN